MRINLPFGYFIGKSSPAPKKAKTRKTGNFLPPVAATSVSTTQLGGGRKSVENLDQLSGFEFWESFNKNSKLVQYALNPSFDVDDFSAMDFDYLTDLLSDLSPEISKALWEFILLCNSGYTTKCYKLDSDEIDEQAQALVDEALEKLGNQHGTLGVFFDRLFKMVFLRGSFLMELVLTDSGEFATIATPDTRTLSFKRITDPVIGQTWDFGQRQMNRDWVSLNLPNIKYVPVHPLPDSIEGHSLCSSALFLAIFLMAVLRDTKRVVQHQGYLRLDVEVIFDKLIQTIPEELAGNAAKMKEWQEEVIDAVQTVYSSLEPDDTFIHGDSIKINNPVGAVNSDSLQAIDALFKAIERMIVRALKTMPIMLALEASRSETQANREWEIYAKGIESCQHWIESAFEYQLKYFLRTQGIQAVVEHRFAQFRAAEKMRDAQVDYLKARTARFKYDSGVYGMPEMAEEMTGKAEADAEEPRDAPAVTGIGNLANINPNEGESRSVREPTIPELDEVESFLEKYGADALDYYEAEVADE